MRTVRHTLIGGATLVTLLAITSGCSGGLADARHPTGSSTMVASSDYTALYTVNTDQGTVSRLDPATGQVDEIPVGLEPTRLAVVGTEVWVTLRNERAIAVLTETADGHLLFDRKIDTGHEPYGIVANEDGDRVYVAASQSGEVYEYGADGTLLRTFPVPDEPRWLALHPRGGALYIGSAFNARVSHVDLDTSTVSAIPLPPAQGFEPANMDVLVDLTPRVTGDPSVSPDGRTLGVPTLYVNNTSQVTGNDLDDGVDMGDGYASSGRSISRLNPVIVSIPLSTGGTPRHDDAEAVFVTSFADLTGFNGEFQTLRSYPSSVVFSPNGYTMLVTMEASGAVIGVPSPRTNADFFEDLDFRSPAATVAVVTDAGPRSVAFLSDDDAWVHSWIGGSVANVAFPQVESQLASASGSGKFDVFMDVEVGSGMTAIGKVDVTADVLPAEVVRGRNLFYSATDSRMVASGGGVSCATCHLEGRNDGLTWALASGDRNTPSLTGQVSLKAPVTWTDNVVSIEAEAMLTSQGRMGGHGLSASDASAIAAYVDFTRHPDTPMKGSDDPAVERGRQLFERDDVGCGTCHTGVELTDNSVHDMAGVTSVRTPGLAGVAATAPYLHNGSLATLRDVLEWARSGEMGDTSMLSDAELSDLEAYLKSL